MESSMSLHRYDAQPSLPRYETLPPEYPRTVSPQLPIDSSYPPRHPREPPTQDTRSCVRLRILRLSAFCRPLCDIWESGAILIFTLHLWIELNVADVVYIYYFIRTSVHPYPRTTVNLSHTGCGFYKAFMYIFGGVISFINYLWVKEYWSWYLFDSWKYYRICWNNIVVWFHGLVVLPASIIFVCGPSLSPIPGLIIMQKLAWNHGCDRFLVNIVLNARASNDPSYYPSTAQFFQGNSPTYTYDSHPPMTGHSVSGLLMP